MSWFMPMVLLHVHLGLLDHAQLFEEAWWGLSFLLAEHVDVMLNELVCSCCRWGRAHNDFLESLEEKLVLQQWVEDGPSSGKILYLQIFETLVGSEVRRSGCSCSAFSTMTFRCPYSKSSLTQTEPSPNTQPDSRGSRPSSHSLASNLWKRETCECSLQLRVYEQNYITYVLLVPVQVHACLGYVRWWMDLIFVGCLLTT
jgi:hypothetical protein